LRRLWSLKISRSQQKNSQKDEKTIISSSNIFSEFTEDEDEEDDVKEDDVKKKGRMNFDFKAGCDTSDDEA